MRVAAGGLNQSIARLYPATLLGLLHHSQGNPVLDTAAGIEQLRLCVNVAFYAERLRHLVESDEGSVADQLGGGEDSGRLAPNMRHTASHGDR